MTVEFWFTLANNTFNTIIIYLPSWLAGSILGVLLSYCIWCLPDKFSKKAYWALSGITFIPVTILIPYFMRWFGLNVFIFPLLAFPVMLITFASSYEAFQHVNRHREMLIINYHMPKFKYFWKIVFRESLPNLKTTTRQTLSLSFAIFLALDYFIEYWNGVGKLAQVYYSRLGFDVSNHYLLLITIAFTAALGIFQVQVNDKLFNKLTEFRRHY